MIKKTLQIATIDEYAHGLPNLPLEQPEKVYISLIEMRINSYTLTVEQGDTVKMGQVIGERQAAFFTEPIISTVSGTVGEIVKKFNYTGKKQEFIEIINDFQDTPCERFTDLSDVEIAKLSKQEIIDKIHANGVKGLGGAGFPTYIKLSTTDPIKYIVVNGVECEPYLTSDYQAMQKDAYEIFKGIEITMQAMNAEQAIIGIKNNKKTLIQHLNQAKKMYFPNMNVKVVAVENYYPAGWEVSLIKDTLGIKVKPKTLPSKYGIVELNVTTMSAIYNAVKYNKPILERYFTVTGDAIANPGQLIVRIGDTIPHVLEACGGFATDESKVLILGGPMMGANLLMDDAVVNITVASILAFKLQEWIEEPCVRCASCVYSCPADLQPVSIMNAVKNKDKDALQALNVANCIECGLCSYVCTSKIHLTDYMRKGKKLA